MSEYRAYKIGSDGHFFEAVPLVCVNDAEAMEKAKQLVWGSEWWCGEGARKLAARGLSITHEVHDGLMLSKRAG
jgi:hypothetical protein